MTLDIVLLYVVLLVSLVVHEAAHALVALLGGDRTAYAGGQVTLNPVPHIKREPFGTVILPLAMLVMSGGSWCMGYASTPIDPHWAHQNPKRAALMSAAGPISNLLLAALAFAALKGLVVADLADPYPTSGEFLAVAPHEPHGFVYGVAKMATVFLLLNIILAVFNLFPWPPLDGAGVVEGLKPNPMERFYAFVRSQVFLMLIGMLLIWRVLPDVYLPVLATVIDWL